MGMNMISHGVQEALKVVKKEFPEMNVLGFTDSIVST